jgi:protease I
VTVHIAAPEAGTVQGMHKFDAGDEFQVDVSLAAMDSSRYKGIVIPGGVINSDYLRVDTHAQRLVREFDQTRQPIAAICHGIWLLVSAEIINGGRLTSYYTLQDDVRHAGGKWVDEPVVVDGNLITSRRPKDLPGFNRALIEQVTAH